jgi:flagellar protein FliO/FliZ
MRATCAPEEMRATCAPEEMRAHGAPADFRLTGRGNLKKLLRVSGACLALAILTAAPAIGQTASQSTADKGQAAAAPVNESELLIPEGPAGAGDAPARAGGAVAPAVSLWDFVRMLLILALVVVAIYVVLRLLRRKAGGRVQENDLIHVLGSRTLAGTRSLHVVEVGSGVYLVGSSDGGVELIAEITDKETLDALRLRAAEEPAGARRSFQAVLAGIFRPARNPSTMGESLGFLKRQRDRLKKL